jgi:hypothetical protein
VSVYVFVGVGVLVNVDVSVYVKVKVLVGVYVLVNVYVGVNVGVYVNVGVLGFMVGVAVNVGVTVNVGDTHSTLNTTGFENSDTMPVAPMPPTFVKLSAHADVVAHHVYEPDWSLMLPRLHVTMLPEVPAVGLDPAYVSPVGTVSNSTAFAATLGTNTMKLLYESSTSPVSPD